MLRQRTKAQALGQLAEDRACRYLQEQGLKLLERNYRCTLGELDMVMKHGSSIVFVEVRYRRSIRYGSGAETVTARKQARLIAAAQHFLLCHRQAARMPSRFDVVSVNYDAGGDNIEWIQNAFLT